MWVFITLNFLLELLLMHPISFFGLLCFHFNLSQDFFIEIDWIYNVILFSQVQHRDQCFLYIGK